MKLISLNTFIIDSWNLNSYERSILCNKYKLNIQNSSKLKQSLGLRLF